MENLSQKVKARVLVGCVHGKPNDVVYIDAALVAGLAGHIDIDPAAIAYAESGDVGLLSAAGGAPLLTSEQLMAAKADIDRAAADLANTQIQLEAQAARQREEADRLDAEAARHAEQAEILATERARLEALAKELEAAKTALAEQAMTGKKKPAA